MITQLGNILLISILTLSGHSFAATNEVDPLLRERLADSMAESLDKFDAAVWLRVSDQRLQRYLDVPEDRLSLMQLIYREASLQGLDPDLVLAVMQIESASNRFAISRQVLRA